MDTKTFLDNIRNIVDAPNGIAELRELILQLAVKGKLATQDGNDIPASALIKDIAKERKTLIADGLIRKQKVLPTIEETEKQHLLPKGWEWARIGHLITLEYGKGLPAKDRNDEGDVPVYGSNGVVGKHDAFIVDKPSIIVGRKGSSGALNIAREACWPTDVTYYVIPPRAIDLDYCFILLQSLRLDAFGKGIKPGLNRNEAYMLVVSLPPLEEQKRIVAKVDQLMALCDQLETQQKQKAQTRSVLNNAALDKLLTAQNSDEFNHHWQRIANNFCHLSDNLDNLTKLRGSILDLAVQGRIVEQDANEESASVLLERILKEKEKLVQDGVIKKQKDLSEVSDDEKLFDIPNGWEWIKFGLSAEFINGDRSKNYPNKNEYVDEGVPWINTGHIEPNGYLTTKDMNYITRKKFDSLRSGKIQKADLVYCLRGATFGKTAFVEPYEEGAIASSLMIIRPYVKELNTYIYRYLISPFGKRQLYRFDNGSAQPNLAANSVMLYAFPLPPLEEQKRIVARVDQLMALCDQLETKLKQTQATGEKLVEATVRSFAAA